MSRQIIALHPKTGEIVPARLKVDHFGPGRDAINFGGINTANYAADDIAWEDAK